MLRRGTLSVWNACYFVNEDTNACVHWLQLVSIITIQYTLCNLVVSQKVTCIVDCPTIDIVHDIEKSGTLNDNMIFINLQSNYYRITRSYYNAIHILGLCKLGTFSQQNMCSYFC